jgi:excisionase family DNA binding protein
MPAEMMTAEDAADFLSLNVKKIYQLANAGRIPATRIGGKWVFPRSLIEEWI